MTVRRPAFLSYKYLIIYADTAIDRAIKGMSACAPSAPLHRRTHASTGTDTSSGRFLMSNKFTGKRHAVNRHSTTRTTGHTPPETGTAYVVHLKNTILQRINHIPYALHDRNVARKSMFRHAIKPISHRRKGFLAVRKSPFRITERRLLRSDMYNTLTLKRLSHHLQNRRIRRQKPFRLQMARSHEGWCNDFLPYLKCHLPTPRGRQKACRPHSITAAMSPRHGGSRSPQRSVTDPSPVTARCHNVNN